MKELVAAAKAKPGSITYASAGAGSATQLNAERFRLGAGFEGVHVPFKGTPEALTDVIAGRVDIYFCPVIAVHAVPQGGPARGARGGQHEALNGAARASHHPRSGHPQLGLQLLGGHGRSVEDPESDRDEAAPEHAESDPDAGPERAHGAGSAPSSGS